jgi:hypothetical protein
MYQLTSLEQPTGMNFPLSLLVSLLPHVLLELPSLVLDVVDSVLAAAALLLMVVILVISVTTSLFLELVATSYLRLLPRVPEPTCVLAILAVLLQMAAKEDAFLRQTQSLPIPLVQDTLAILPTDLPFIPICVLPFAL